MNEKTRVDQWVRKEIENLGVRYTEQSSTIDEVRKALKNASKQGGTGTGKPEFVFLVKNTLVIVEDKISTSDLELLSDDGNLDLSVPKATAKFAVNGAVHYAKHIVEKTVSYKEVIAIGASGSYEERKSKVYLVKNDNGITNISNIGLIDDWNIFSPAKFDEWYAVNVLGELSTDIKQELKLKQLASELHENLRNYSNLEGEHKATVVSAILLALNEPSFKIENLNGFNQPSDGEIIFNAIKYFMHKNEISPEFKVDVVMHKFGFIKTNIALNTVLDKLGNQTPIKYFARFLSEKVLHHIKNNVEEDILGNFYGEFVKYGGNDGNSLGIVLTPTHITSLMADLIDVSRNDFVLDPTAGSGSFLISAMSKMLRDPYQNDVYTNEHVKQKQLIGIEIQEKMYTVATTNMILRGDGKANLMLADLFTKKKSDFKSLEARITKVLMNPPYSQGSKENAHLYEINFIKHSLDFIEKGGKLAAIVPQSVMTGKTAEERQVRKSILENHTLEAVITLNPLTFHGQRAGVQPVIAIFLAGTKHESDRRVKFVNFIDDGWNVRKHIGLIDDGTVDSKRTKLMNVIKNDIVESTNFLVKSAITADDDWLHSFFYFNDALPNEEDFYDVIKDFIIFVTSQIIQAREKLFYNMRFVKKSSNTMKMRVTDLVWKEFVVEDIFEVVNCSPKHKIELKESINGVPYVTRTAQNNGLEAIVEYDNNDLNPANVITFGAESVKFFYQPYKFLTGNKMYYLRLKDRDLELEEGLFIQLICQHSLNNSGFGYGMGLTGNRFSKRKIILPVDNDENINWNFISNFSARIIQNILNRTKIFFD